VNRPLSWFALRRLADERAAALGLALLVFVTALVAAGGPRAFEQLANAALRQELGAANSFERSTVIYEVARPLASPLSELGELEAAGDRLEEAFPAELRGLISSRSELVETPLWEVFAGTDLNGVMSLRIQQGALERLRLVSGRLPSGSISVQPDERPFAPPGQRAWIYEAVVSAAAAAELAVEVGDRLGLGVWLNDPLNLGQNEGAFIDIVGTYEIEDPADEFWINDEPLAGWRLNIVPPDMTFIQTTALLSPDVYRALVTNTQGQGMTLLYQWRFYVEAERLRAERLPQTITALRRLEGAVPRTGISEVPSDTTMSSGMLRLLLQHEASWRSAEAILTIVALGLLSIALATLGVVAAVSSGGRRRVASLLRARGASGRQLLLMTGLEAALLALPSVGLALAVAVLLVPLGSVPRTLVPAALVWAALTVILSALVSRESGGRAGENESASRAGRRHTPRRLVGEAAIVLGAAAGAWLLRGRGLSGAGSTSELAGADPLIAAVPALVGLAAGLLAMRIYPLPTRLLAALASRRRDLLPVLAVRRATRGGSSALVLLLLVLTSSLGTFAAATLAHLERAADLGAWHELGAEYRLRSPTLALPASLDEEQLPGVEAAARASLRSVGTTSGASSSASWLLALDLLEYQQVSAGTPAEVRLAGDLLAPEPGERVPAIVGPGLGLTVGGTFEASIGGRQVPLRVVQAANSFPGLPSGANFVVVSRSHLGSAFGGRPPAAGISLLRAAPASTAELRSALGEVAPGVLLESRHELSQQTRSAPVMGALRMLIGAAALLALAYAALAIGAALALAAAAQRDQLAHLRALGLSRRSALWLSFVEYGPAALVGYLLGAALGLGLFAFLRPALGLSSVTGSSIEIPVGVEPAALIVLLASIMGILVVGWLLGALTQRDTNPASAIRRGIE
jgi:putative ABC transport system permease protein